MVPACLLKRIGEFYWSDNGSYVGNIHVNPDTGEEVPGNDFEEFLRCASPIYYLVLVGDWMVRYWGFFNFSYNMPQGGDLDIRGTIYFVEVGLSSRYWQAMKRPIRMFYRKKVAALVAIKCCPRKKANGGWVVLVERATRSSLVQNNYIAEFNDRFQRHYTCIVVP